MKQLVSNYHSVFSTSFIYERSPFSTFLLSQAQRQKQSKDVSPGFHSSCTKARESEGSFPYGGYWREADDFHAVIQHFCGAKHVIHAILGHSKGGDVVLLYASKYHDIHMVLNVSGRYNLKRGIDEHLGEDFLERIKKGEDLSPLSTMWLRHLQ